jgi:hypothetical protein
MLTTAAILPFRLRLIAALVALALLLFVIQLIRGHRIGLRDSLVWLLSTAGALLFVLVPDLLVHLAHALGVVVPANAAFAIALVYILLNLLTLTISISQSANRNRRLSQECALLRAKLEELEEAVARSGNRPADG